MGRLQNIKSVSVATIVSANPFQEVSVLDKTASGLSDPVKNVLWIRLNMMFFFKLRAHMWITQQQQHANNQSLCVRAAACSCESQSTVCSIKVFNAVTGSVFRLLISTSRTALRPGSFPHRHC